MTALARLLRRLRGPAVVLAFAALVACGATARQRTLHAALVTVDAASVAFVEVNKAKLDEIAAADTPRGPEGYKIDLARVESWEAKSEPVLNGLRLAYRLIAAAALDSDASLDEVIATVAGLVQDVKNLRGEP